MSMNSKPRRVDFFIYDEDYQCALLASLGFSNRCIIQHTKLTPGKITYRLKKANIKRMDYRDGASDVATMVMRGMRGAIEKEVTHYLRKTLL
jgi:hypothetical protein